MKKFDLTQLVNTLSQDSAILAAMYELMTSQSFRHRGCEDTALTRGYAFSRIESRRTIVSYMADFVEAVPTHPADRDTHGTFRTLQFVHPTQVVQRYWPAKPAQG